MSERRRFSSPIVVLIAAVALILGSFGTATAGGLTSAKVKKIAAKVVAKKAPGLSVAHAKTATNAQNAGTLDNLDSGDFARAGSEAWHVIGTAGEPAFDNGTTCQWSNYDNVHSPAAFLRDAAGFVHIKGLVRAINPGAGNDECVIGDVYSDHQIFVLPPGYRPERREVIVTLSDSAIGRININTNGVVAADSPATGASVKHWFALDNVSFRCAPSGVNGCP